MTGACDHSDCFLGRISLDHGQYTLLSGTWEGISERLKLMIPIVNECILQSQICY